MTSPQPTTLDALAYVGVKALEYACYGVLIGAVCVGWVITS